MDSNCKHTPTAQQLADEIAPILVENLKKNVKEFWDRMAEDRPECPQPEWRQCDEFPKVYFVPSITYKDLGYRRDVDGNLIDPNGVGEMKS